MRKRPNLVALSCIALLLGACHDDDKPTPTPTPTASPTPTPSSSPTPTPSQEDSAETATPIKHLVVIFDENESFDHYFGTYPTAANPNGEPMFTAAADTPEVNGYNRDKALLTDNPNTRNADNLATGIAAAAVSGKAISSARFSRTLTKMLAFGSLIIVAAVVPKHVLGAGVAEGMSVTLILSVIILNESLSIAENAEKMGYGFPWMRKMLRDRIADVAASATREANP